MAMEQSNGQTTYDDSQKKAKLEVNMGFASSNSSGAAAEGAGETFTSQAETQAHGSGSATNWQQQQSHQPHHPHAPQQQQQAYASPPHYPSGYFSQVGATSCVDETRISLNKLQGFLSKVESNLYSALLRSLANVHDNGLINEGILDPFFRWMTQSSGGNKWNSDGKLRALIVCLIMFVASLWWLQVH